MKNFTNNEIYNTIKFAKLVIKELKYVIDISEDEILKRGQYELLNETITLEERTTNDNINDEIKRRIRNE